MIKIPNPTFITPPGFQAGFLEELFIS